MSKYYHYWLTCPFCNAPHNILEKEARNLKIGPDNIAICYNCHNSFQALVPINRNGKEVAVPLFWDIHPNTIEQSYIDWLKTGPEGKYVILWPWKSVKISPILIREYLKNTTSSRPVILYSPNVAKLHTKGFRGLPVSSPCPNILWSWLIELESPHSENSIFRKNLYKMLDKIFFPKGRDVTKIYYHSPLGSGAIILDENMEIELPYKAKIIKREKERIKLKPYYTKRWMIEVINAFDEDMAKQNKNFKIKEFVITNENDLSDISIEREGLVFIRLARRGRDLIQPQKKILETTVKDPKLVIIEDLECCLHKFRVKNFFEFIESLPEDCLTFMFSPNRRQRYLHTQLNKFFKEITWHCWDTPLRLENLKEEWEETKYFSPASAKYNEIILETDNEDN